MSRPDWACLVQAVICVLLPCICTGQQAAPDHAADLEEIVITASPIGDPDRLATIAGSVDRDTLLRSGGATIADALVMVPGVTSSGFAAGAGRPVIRGMDANRVRILADGIGSFDVSDVGPDHGVPIDPLSTQRVEVVRGAATLRYGSQAIGGVVNAISNRVPQALPEKAVTGELTGGAGSGAGSGADSGDFAGQINARSGDFAWHADGYTRRADDYGTPEGPMTNSWLRGEGGALGGAWIGAGNRIGLGIASTGSRYGIPGEETHIDMQQTRLSLRSAFDLGEGAWRNLTVDGGWADYEHSERDAQQALATFKDREWDVRAEAVLGRTGFLSESALGMQLQQRDFSALGEGADYLAPTRTQSQALFGFTEAPLSKALRLQFGARLEQVDVDGTPANEVPVSRSFSPASVALGLMFDPGQAWRLGLMLSSAARAPAQTELYARGVHEATATWEIGDADLQQERANSAELSLRWRAGRVHADGSVWVTKFSDYILGSWTGRSCDEEGNCAPGDGELRELVYAQQDAQFHGAEAHAQIELRKGAAGDLHLDLLGDVVRAQLNDGGNVPRIPPWHLGAGLSWQGERLDAGMLVKYSARQSDTAENETPTTAFTTVDAQLAWRPWSAHPGIELALIGRNLADSVQRNAVALNKDEVLLPGRDIRLMFRAQLN